MKIKRKHVLIIGVIAIILVMINIAILIKRVYKEDIGIVKKDEIIIEFSEICFDNGWSKEHVTAIKDDIPVPAGYAYVQGDVETGFVVTDGEENYYMWIPYNEEANIENIDEYFPESNEVNIDYEPAMSMRDYKGFYISLVTENGELDKLKNLNAEQYENEKKLIEEKNINDNSINTHLISKSELEQMIYYIQSKNINGVTLGNGGIPRENRDAPEGKKDTKGGNGEVHYFEGIEVTNIESWQSAKAYVEILNDPKKVKEIEQKGFYTIEFKEKDENGNEIVHYAYVPEGFNWKICGEDDTVEPTKAKAKRLEIQSEDNPNLVYVWISTEKLELDGTKNFSEEASNFFEAALSEYNKIITQNGGSPIINAITEVDDTLAPDIEYSIRKFDGFYMAQGEVTKDANGSIGTAVQATENSFNGTYKLNENTNITISEMKLEADEIASSVLQENNNVISLVAPMGCFQIVKAQNMQEAIKPQNPDKNAEDNPENQNINEKTPVNGIFDFNGGNSEVVGDGKKNDSFFINSDEPIKNFNQSDDLILSGADWATSGNIQNNGGGLFSIYNEEDLQGKQTGTIGIRLCLFLSDVNRHADYFELKTDRKWSEICVFKIKCT